MARTFYLALLVAAALLLSVSDARVTNDKVFNSDKVFKLTHLSRQDLANLAPWKVAAIRSLQLKLLKFRTLYDIAVNNRACLAERDAVIERAVEALEAARRCRYNGLPWNIFGALRPTCALRSTQSRRVMELRRYCNNLKYDKYRYQCRMNKLTPASNCLIEIQAVCKRLGLLDGPKLCPAIQPLRDAVNLARAKDCGIGFFTFQEVVDSINEIIARIRELLEGNPLPSDDPRFIDVPLDPVSI